MEYVLATYTDAPAIASLINATWNTPVDEGWVAECASRPGYAPWIAKEHENVVGFCSAFSTRAADGIHRWEIDLLAVASRRRGNGVGKALVAHTVKSGWQHGATLQRGLVAVDNPPSQRCFEANGFHSTAVCDVWVGPPAVLVETMLFTPNAHFVPVDTLTYRGIWVEESVDPAALSAAQQIALAQGRNTVGAVIPHGMSHSCDALNFTCIGTYQWWTLSNL